MIPGKKKNKDIIRMVQKALTSTCMLANLKMCHTKFKILIQNLKNYNNIFIEISPSKIQQFESIQIRSSMIRNGRRSNVKLQSINHIRNRLGAVEVFKCLNSLAPPDLMEYFNCVKHSKDICRNEHSLLLPIVKSEARRKTFAFQAAKHLIRFPTD